MSRFLFITTLVLVYTISAGPVSARSAGAAADSSSVDKDPGEKGFGLDIFGGRAKLAALPIPAYSESIGWSIGLAVTGFYKVDQSDTISPESVTALFGFYAENKSWAAGAFQKFHLDEDRWRAQFGGMVGEINFQAFASLPDWLGGGTFIDYTSDMTFLLAQGSRLVWERLYLGAKYRYMNSQTIFHIDLPAGTTLEPRVFSGIGAVATWDSRDNIFYPLKGFYVDLWTLWNRDGIGSD